MNQLNTENLVENLLTGLQYDVQVPYLMYRDTADEVIGIWFYDQKECLEVAHLFSRIHDALSPKSNCSSKSVFEELEVASALPAAEATLEQSTSPTIVPHDSKNEFLATLFSREAACVGDTISGTGAAGPNQSFTSVRLPSHQPHSASVSQTSALHNLLPSRTFSVHIMPFDDIIYHNSATIQPSSPQFLPPMKPTQTTMSKATSSSLSVLPTVHPPLASHQPRSVPLHHQPFPLPLASPASPYGMPSFQPFSPPKPSPLLIPAASCVPELTRDQVKGALLRLVNVLFLDYESPVGMIISSICSIGRLKRDRTLAERLCLL